MAPKRGPASGPCGPDALKLSQLVIFSANNRPSRRRGAKSGAHWAFLELLLAPCAIKRSKLLTGRSIFLSRISLSLSRFISSDVDFTDLVSPLGFEMRSKQARHTLICGKRRKVISHCLQRFVVNYSASLSYFRNLMSVIP